MTESPHKSPSETFGKNKEYIKQYFKFPCDPKANPDAVIEGDKYRITILTPRIIRLEYSPQGKFVDQPSQAIWFRKLSPSLVSKPDFKKTFTGFDNSILKIETDYLILTYDTHSKFSSKSLKILVKNKSVTWKFGKKDRGNLKGTYRTLDARNGGVRLKRGLISRSGYSILDDSNSLIFDENGWIEPRSALETDDGSKRNIDIYFFGHGDDYLGCIDEFYKISGKTPLIPRFILGNWWSRYWAYNEPELKELIIGFEKYQIPLSVCIIDMDWHLVDIDKKYGRGWTGYTWNKELFPDPKAMLDWLHSKRLKISLNLHPADGIRGYEECYQEVADFMGYTEEEKVNEKPIEFDISDPKFMSAYFDLVHYPLEDMGVDFWWMDWQQGTRSKIKNLDPLWMLNHLHFLDLGRDGKKRPFIFSRWGGYGNQRYPIGFSGDTFSTWRSLNFQPYFTVTASNIGYGWWSHDIGGHMLGRERPELYTRWVQFGIFSPINRLHTSKGIVYKREPWKYDEEVLYNIGNAMRLRHKIIPYIYTMAYRNYSNNIPLMRPLYYYEQNEENAYKFKNEYWFGSELLVHPITKPLSKKTLRILHKTYLPKRDTGNKEIKGGFYNFFTGEYYPSGSIIEDIYRLRDIPVFAKAGAIIPMDGNGVRNEPTNPELLEIVIFPGASNSFELYEDDGVSTDYKKRDNIGFLISKIGVEWEDIGDNSLDFEPESAPIVSGNNLVSKLDSKISKMRVTIENPSAALSNGKDSELPAFIPKNREIVIKIVNFMPIMPDYAESTNTSGIAVNISTNRESNSTNNNGNNNTNNNGNNNTNNNDSNNTNNNDSNNTNNNIIRNISIESGVFNTDPDELRNKIEAVYGTTDDKEGLHYINYKLDDRAITIHIPSVKFQKIDIELKGVRKLPRWSNEKAMDVLLAANVETLTKFILHKKFFNGKNKFEKDDRYKEFPLKKLKKLVKWIKILR